MLKIDTSELEKLIRDLEGVASRCSNVDFAPVSMEVVDTDKKALLDALIRANQSKDYKEISRITKIIKDSGDTEFVGNIKSEMIKRFGEKIISYIGL
ncbi:MAG: hypothetical protein ACOC5T_03070 [Elusimicrobiota bacterium]